MKVFVEATYADSFGPYSGKWFEINLYSLCSGGEDSLRSISQMAPTNLAEIRLAPGLPHFAMEFATMIEPILTQSTLGPVDVAIFGSKSGTAISVPSDWLSGEKMRNYAPNSRRYVLTSLYNLVYSKDVERAELMMASLHSLELRRPRSLQGTANVEGNCAELGIELRKITTQIEKDLLIGAKPQYSKLYFLLKVVYEASKKHILVPQEQDYGTCPAVSVNFRAGCFLDPALPDVLRVSHELLTYYTSDGKQPRVLKAIYEVFITALPKSKSERRKARRVGNKSRLAKRKSAIAKF